MLAETAYGKSRVRLVKVARHGDRHDLTDLTVGIRFEGGYDRSYTDGDNRDVLPTDTMKNTVYALAAEYDLAAPETFGVRLAEHFLERNSQLVRVRIDIAAATGTRSDRDLFDELGEDLAALGIERALFVLNGVPFTVSGHKS